LLAGRAATVDGYSHPPRLPDPKSNRTGKTNKSSFNDLCEIRGVGCLANFTRGEGPFAEDSRRRTTGVNVARGGLDGPIHSSQAFRAAASKLRMHHILEGMCELLHAQA